MITKQYVDEVERLNQLPLSQEALKRLKEAKAEYQHYLLYLLQLAEWGLEQGIEFQGVKRQMLESILLNLRDDPNQQQVFRYLTMSWEPEWPEDADERIRVENLQTTPEEAAEAILQEIAEKVLLSPKLNPIW